MSQWIHCAHCGLKHSARPDGKCPRCQQLSGGGAGNAADTGGNIYAPPQSSFEPESAPERAPERAPDRAPAGAPIGTGRSVFNARAVYALKLDCLYRLYILPGEACFIKIGGQGFSRSFAVALRHQLGLIGALIGHALLKRSEDSLRQKVRELDASDPQTLARTEKESFVVAAGSFVKSVLDGPSLFSGHGQQTGVWNVELRDGRKLRLQIETQEDMETAFRVLPGFVGSAHDMKVTWDPAKGEIVKKK
jgi:hypothetical protein